MLRYAQHDIIQMWTPLKGWLFELLCGELSALLKLSPWSEAKGLSFGFELDASLRSHTEHPTQRMLCECGQHDIPWIGQGFLAWPRKRSSRNDTGVVPYFPNTKYNPPLKVLPLLSVHSGALNPFKVSPPSPTLRLYETPGVI